MVEMLSTPVMLSRDLEEQQMGRFRIVLRIL